MVNLRKYRIFVISDIRSLSEKIKQLLKQYKSYEVFFMPTDFNLFDLYSFEPDVVIMDQNATNIVNCYKWK